MPRDDWHLYSSQIGFKQCKSLLLMQLTSRIILIYEMHTPTKEEAKTRLHRFSSDYILWKKNVSQRDRRYEKMLLLILDYFIWLVTAGSFILGERFVTFMAGRRPSKGLRAWQTTETVRPEQRWSCLSLGPLGIGEALWSQWWLRFLPWHIHTQSAAQTSTHSHMRRRR